MASEVKVKLGLRPTGVPKSLNYRGKRYVRYSGYSGRGYTRGHDVNIASVRGTVNVALNYYVKAIIVSYKFKHFHSKRTMTGYGVFARERRPATVRWFGGKRYSRFSNFPWGNKRDVTKRAKYLREDGFKVRILKTKQGYYIYKRG